MALIHCKECGKDVSEKAKSCPHCGSPVPQKTGAGGKAVLFIFGVLLFFLIIGLASDGGSSSAAASSKGPPTTASITKTLTTLSITNTNDFAWVNPEIWVNGVLGGYSYQWQGTVSPGEQLEIGLANFTKNNGDRFQPFETDVKKVFISVSGHDSNVYVY